MKTPMQLCLIFILSFALLSCASNKLQVEKLESKNYGERVKLLVMHFTAIDYKESVEALVEEGGLSAHYLIPERHDPSYTSDKLKVIQLVDESDRAWHAGSSFWQGRIDVNDQSIGIEIVNVPECFRDSDSLQSETRENGSDRLCLFPDYDPKQIELLVELSKQILARNPDISPTRVVGHSDITPQRKNDPGPRFPWYHLYKNGVGAWYENETLNTYWQVFNNDLPSVSTIQQALSLYGYGIEKTGVLDPQSIDTISAFQMHFLPHNVHGKIDSQTAAALFALLEKYFPEPAQALFQAYQQEVENSKLTTAAISQSQLSWEFPQTQRSSRKWVNDRASFHHYAKRGELVIHNTDAQSADIYINGQKLDLGAPLLPLRQYRYSLNRFTRNGTNTLKVENIKPIGSGFKISVPFPTLIDNIDENNHIFSEVDRLIADDIEEGFPGAVLVVVKDGEVIKRSAYGYARKYFDCGEVMPSAIPMTTEHGFDLASNTKMYATNIALMKLVSEGKLDVNLPVSYYLKEYTGGGRDAHLVKDLLTHRAGYAPEVRFFTKDNALGEHFFSQNKTRTSRLLTTQIPSNAHSGNTPVYSDTDYMLLGLLIERITGLALDDYVEHEIYHPLGLKRTVFNPLQKGFTANQFAATEIEGNSREGRIEFENMRTHVLQGEVHDEKAFYSMQGVAGHAGLFSTADELAILTQMLLNGGGYGEARVLNNAVLEHFVKPEESDDSYGLGWRRAADGQRKWQFGPYASHNAYGHTGWTGTLTVIDPEHDLAIVLLTNSRHSPILNDDKGIEFEGKRFETGKYGSIVSLIYESVLNNSNSD